MHFGEHIASIPFFSLCPPDYQTARRRGGAFLRRWLGTCFVVNLRNRRSLHAKYVAKPAQSYRMTAVGFRDSAVAKNPDTFSSGGQ